MNHPVAGERYINTLGSEVTIIELVAMNSGYFGYVYSSKVTKKGHIRQGAIVFMRPDSDASEWTKVE